MCIYYQKIPRPNEKRRMENVEEERIGMRRKQQRIRKWSTRNGKREGHEEGWKGKMGGGRNGNSNERMEMGGR
jgi:hypothetical protein